MASEKRRYFFRYIVAGLSGAFLQIVILWIWVSILGLKQYYLFGVVAAFCCALAFTFPLQKYWTFRDVSTEKIKRQFFSYTLIALVGLTLTTILFATAKSFFESFRVDFFHQWYLFAQAFIVAAVAAINFFLNRATTFKDVSVESE